MNSAFPCKDENCRHRRPFVIQKRDRFVEVGAIYENLLFCMTCSRFDPPDRFEGKLKAGRRKKINL